SRCARAQKISATELWTAILPSKKSLSAARHSSVSTGSIAINAIREDFDDPDAVSFSNDMDRNSTLLDYRRADPFGLGPIMEGALNAAVVAGVVRPKGCGCPRCSNRH